MQKRIVSLELTVFAKSEEAMSDTMATVEGFLDQLRRDLKQQGKPTAASLINSIDVTDCEEFE
jgi:BMFP domain-containing protein YqiC